MRPRRWASTVGNKFQFAVLVPARRDSRVRDGRRPRIGPEPVGATCSFEKQQFDEAPDINAEYDKGEGEGHIGFVVKPVHDAAKQGRSDEEGDDPPAAFVAIVKPLDRGGRQEPDADNRDRRSRHVEQNGNEGRRIRISAAEIGAEREGRRIAEDFEELDVNGFDVGAEDDA